MLSSYLSPPPVTLSSSSSFKATVLLLSFSKKNSESKIIPNLNTFYHSFRHDTITRFESHYLLKDLLAVNALKTKKRLLLLLNSNLIMTEKEGFEPSHRYQRPAPFPGVSLQPLGYFSIW